MKAQTLQRQFRLWTFLLVVIPSLLIMTIYTIGQIHLAKQQNMELIHQRVDSQVRLIDYWMQERAQNVRELSLSNDFRSLDKQQMKRTLDLMQQLDKSFDSLSYIDKNGYFMMSTLSTGIRYSSAKDKPYFEAAEAGKEYISDVVIGRNSGQPIINFSAPIYDYAGDFQGLVLGSVKTTTLGVLLRENWIGQTGEVFLVNRGGTLLTEPREFDALMANGLIQGTAVMKLKITEDALSHIQLGESGTASWNDYLGRRVLGAYLDLPDRGWTLIGKVNEEEVLTPIYKQLTMMSFGTALLIILILPLANVISNRIKLPIDWLIRQANQVATENYEMLGRDQYSGNISYELDILCQTFIRMSNKIENTVRLLKKNEIQLESKMVEIQEINAALEEEVMERQVAQAALGNLNIELENKVDERTRNLQDLNAALEEEIMERQIAQDALNQKTEVIQQIAYSDSLTGLPNRAHLNAQLKAEMERTRRNQSAGAVLFIDLDDLKMVNDAFGHTYGDALIKMAGNRIVEAAGDSAFVGRIGGDEFMVILSDEYDQKSITETADKIIRAFNQDMEALGICFHTSASAGVAVYPRDGDTTEEIFKNADNAMYAAKKAGKNCWRLYQANMQMEAYDKMLLINSLRQAIDRGELMLHYQPQVSMDSVTAGFEALLRWNSPEHGYISPVRFIRLAEQSGLIQSIGNWVLREACQFARRLADNGWGHIHVAVNVSPYQLCAEGFIDSVSQALSSAGIEPSQLELEITENALIESLEESTHILKKIQNMGVGLSLDDFGTGYSSLTYLQRLPVKTLKIDKAFIDMILTDEAQKAIIGTIVDMAHIMEMSVVAEGVEEESQMEYLAKCRCDLIQGHIISPPIPENEAVRFLSR